MHDPQKGNAADAFKKYRERAAKITEQGELMTNGWGKKGKRRGWTAKDIRELKSLAKKKTPARQIARELGRTESAVRQRAMAVGTSLDTRTRARRK